MKNMLSHINSTAKSIWRKMRNKEYRDPFVAANISNTISAQIHTMRESRKGLKRNWYRAAICASRGFPPLKTQNAKT